MSGIEYAVLVFATVLLVVAIIADDWKKKNNK
jgi:hypothetical protein